MDEGGLDRCVKKKKNHLKFLWNCCRSCTLFVLQPVFKKNHLKYLPGDHVLHFGVFLVHYVEVREYLRVSGTSGGHICAALEHRVTCWLPVRVVCLPVLDVVI